MDYLLDTNICIYIANRQPSAVVSRLENLRPGDVGMSIVTYLELVNGAWKSRRKHDNLAKVQELVCARIGFACRELDMKTVSG